jgi:hypothetical protein
VERACTRNLAAEDVVELAVLDSDVDNLDLVASEGRVHGRAATRNEALGVRRRRRSDVCEQLVVVQDERKEKAQGRTSVLDVRRNEEILREWMSIMAGVHL